MARRPIILDIETKYTFRDFSDHRKLEVAVAVAYDYATDKPYFFFENGLGGLFRLIESSSYVIGYNVSGFDMPVLQAYYVGDVMKFPIFDILEDIRSIIGRRIGLNDVVSATLGKKKSAIGLMAIDFYREGRLEELKQYCFDDVMLTKAVFDYGVEHGKIHYLNEHGKVDIPVNWKKYLDGSNALTMTEMSLPF